MPLSFPTKRCVLSGRHKHPPTQHWQFLEGRSRGKDKAGPFLSWRKPQDACRESRRGCAQVHAFRRPQEPREQLWGWGGGSDDGAWMGDSKARVGTPDSRPQSWGRSVSFTPSWTLIPLSFTSAPHHVHAAGQGKLRPGLPLDEVLPCFLPSLPHTPVP